MKHPNRKFVSVLLGVAMVIICFFSLCSCSMQEPEMLADPQNIQTANRVITWDPVENAIGYLVTFDGKEHRVEENSFQYHFLKTPGTYTFSVIALGDGKKHGNSVIAYQSITLEPPVEHGFDEQGFEYTFDYDIGGYEIDRGTSSITGNIILPDYYMDYPVKRIAGKMFVADDAYGSFMDAPNCFNEMFCNKVTTGVKLPAYLETIGSCAFEGCIVLEEIVLPNTVAKIGAKAFEGCKRLKNVTFSKGLKEIKRDCFRDTALSEIILPEGLERIEGNAFATLDTEYWVGNVYIGAPMTGHIDSDVTEVVIPASVKSIGGYAFAGRRKLETITITERITDGVLRSSFEYTAWMASQPDGFVYFADYLCFYKGELPPNAKIEVPAGTKGICANAFENQKNLREVVLPEGIEYWGGNIFAQCTSLTTASLPADMKKIPSGMFMECTSLKTVTLPEGLTTIDVYAFAYSGLESITIPTTVKSERTAFHFCESLKEIYFPSGMEEIGVCCLQGCSALETVFIPSSVKEIEDNPFVLCDSLTHVFYEGSSFSDFIKKFKRVDEELLAQLEATPIYFYSEEKPTEEGLYWHYVDGKPTPWESEE